MKTLAISLILIIGAAASAKRAPAYFKQGFNLESTQQVYSLEAPKGENFVYSPYSLKMALGLLSQGAGEDSATEAILSETLGYPGYSSDQLGQHLKELQTQINKDSGEFVTLESANSVLVNRNFEIGQNFLNRVTDFFSALVRNFSPTIVGEANEWVNQKTRGKIKEIVNPNDVLPDRVAVLLNAVYFKGNWQTQFNPEMTLTSQFQQEDGTEVQTEMMNLYRTKLPFKQMYSGTKLLKLPFKKTKEGKTLVSMYFFLPSEDSDLDTVFEKEITNEMFWRTLDSRPLNRTVLGRVSLPKYKIESQIDLQEALFKMPTTDMGPIGHIFSGPDLSGITKEAPLKVSSIAQKAYLAVTEEGAEAAAVTKVVVVTRSIKRTQSFIADRPFAYVIRHEGTGEILFVGTHVKKAE